MQQNISQGRGDESSSLLTRPPTQIRWNQYCSYDGINECIRRMVTYRSPCRYSPVTVVAEPLAATPIESEFNIEKGLFVSCNLHKSYSAISVSFFQVGFLRDF